MFQSEQEKNVINETKTQYATRNVKFTAGVNTLILLQLLFCSSLIDVQRIKYNLSWSDFWIRPVMMNCPLLQTAHTALPHGWLPHRPLSLIIFPIGLAPSFLPLSSPFLPSTVHTSSSYHPHPLPAVSLFLFFSPLRPQSAHSQVRHDIVIDTGRVERWKALLVRLRVLYGSQEGQNNWVKTTTTKTVKTKIKKYVCSKKNQDNYPQE